MENYNGAKSWVGEAHEAGQGVDHMGIDLLGLREVREEQRLKEGIQ
jgi:hypothetical protein